MGLGCVLILWAIAGLIISGIFSAVFSGAAAVFTRGIQTGRSKVIIAAFFFPFLCLGWAACVFVFQAVVNENLLGRDSGMGDTWHCPLPNGYQILMIDVTDQGWVYNPKTQPGSGVGERDDAIGGIRAMQVAGRYVLGSTTSSSFDPANLGKDKVDGYFLLDTAAGKHDAFSSLAALRTRANELNITTDLQPIYGVYSRYRFSWFEVVSGMLFCIPPLSGTVVLIAWIRRVRRHRW
jgi:hypothetical protein